MIRMARACWLSIRTTRCASGSAKARRITRSTALRRSAILHPTDGGSTLARIESGSQIELQYSDALQNLMLTLNAQGHAVASFIYGPFGEVVKATGTDDHRRQFNGKEHDAVSGLRYYGFRYYDPLTLRWNSADPLYRFVPDLGQSAPQRMNLYAFSMNNPVRYYDPDGRVARSDSGSGSGDPTTEGSPQGGPYCDTGPWSQRLCEGDSPDASDEDSPAGGSSADEDVLEMEPMVFERNEPTLEMEPEVICTQRCQIMKDNLQSSLDALKSVKEAYDMLRDQPSEELRKGKPPSTKDTIVGTLTIGGAAVGALGASAEGGLVGCLVVCPGAVLTMYGGFDRAASNKPYETGDERGERYQAMRDDAQYQSRRTAEQMHDFKCNWTRLGMP